MSLVAELSLLREFLFCLRSDSEGSHQHWSKLQPYQTKQVCILYNEMISHPLIKVTINWSALKDYMISSWEIKESLKLPTGKMVITKTLEGCVIRKTVTSKFCEELLVSIYYYAYFPSVIKTVTSIISCFEVKVNSAWYWLLY